MLFPKINFITDYIGEINPSIRQRFAFFFYEPTDISLFFTAVTGKHSENDIVTKKKTVNQIKRNEGTRESKTFTRRGLQAEHQTGIMRQKQNFTAFADKSKNEREEAVRLFWTFQASVGGRRCRSCTRSRARKASSKKRKKGWRRPRSDLWSSFIITQTVASYRPLLRSGSDVSARWKIRQTSCDTRRLQNCKPKTSSLSSFYDKNLFFNILSEPAYVNEVWIIKIYKNKNYR